MCYSVYISTNSKKDLSKHNSPLISFEKEIKNSDKEIIDLLQYDRLWYVASKTDCSCTFRHYASAEIGFGEPVDCYEELKDAIEATKVFYDVIAELILSNHRADCVSVWTEAKTDQFKTVDVDMASVSKEEFWFFENY